MVDLTIVFYVEQVILLLIAIISFLLFALELTAEQFQRSIDSISYKYHRLGLFVSGLLIIICVDPFGVHNNIAPDVIAVLEMNNDILLAFAFALLNQGLLSYYYKTVYARSGVPWLYRVLFWSFFAFSFVFGNCLYIGGALNNRWWYTGLFLLWFSFYLFVIGFSYVYHSYYLYYFFAAEQSEQAEEESVREEKMRQVKNKGITAFFVGLFFVLWTLVSAISRLGNRGNFQEPDLDSFNLGDRVELYAQFLAMFYLLNYSWIPLNLYGMLYGFPDTEDHHPIQVSWRNIVKDRLDNDPSLRVPSVKSQQAPPPHPDEEELDEE